MSVTVSRFRFKLHTKLARYRYITNFVRIFQPFLWMYGKANFIHLDLSYATRKPFVSLPGSHFTGVTTQPNSSLKPIEAQSGCTRWLGNLVHQKWEDLVCSQSKYVYSSCLLSRKKPVQSSLRNIYKIHTRRIQLPK